MMSKQLAFEHVFSMAEQYAKEIKEDGHDISSNLLLKNIESSKNELAALRDQLARAEAERDALREIIKQALLNEGQDGCTKPVIGWCLCWRCKAKAALEQPK